MGSPLTMEVAAAQGIAAAHMPVASLLSMGSPQSVVPPSAEIMLSVGGRSG